MFRFTQATVEVGQLHRKKNPFRDTVTDTILSLGSPWSTHCCRLEEYLEAISLWFCLVLLFFRFCFGSCWAFWGHLAMPISVSPKVALMRFFLGFSTRYAQNTWQILMFRRTLQASNEQNQESWLHFPTLIILFPSCFPVAGHCAGAFGSLLEYFCFNEVFIKRAKHLHGYT